METFKRMRKRHLEDLLNMVKKEVTIDHFQAMVDAVFSQYGFSRSLCAKDLKIGRSTVSKWCNRQAVPGHPTMLSVQSWAVSEIEKEIAE